VIDLILPSKAVAVEAFDDTIPVRLFAEEEELVVRAVDKRRQEFATARRCAREALAVLGHPPAPILPGERRAPIWPDGIVGSITHCVGYRAAVVATREVLWTVGVDAEPNTPLPVGLLSSIARPEEEQAVQQLLATDSRIRWDRLLFSAKEAVYKAWFPLTLRWLDFDEVTVTFDAASGRFDARLHTSAVVDGIALTDFTGRFLAERGFVVTAVARPAPRSASPTATSGGRLPQG
jgi:4'-phosphopantetheinyl transferase EntD